MLKNLQIVNFQNKLLFHFLIMFKFYLIFFSFFQIILVIINLITSFTLFMFIQLFYYPIPIQLHY